LGGLSHGVHLSPHLESRQAVGEIEGLVSVVPAIPEPVESELTGVLARHHAGPRGNRDRRLAASEIPPIACPHQGLQVCEALQVLAEGKLGGEAVQPDDQDLAGLHLLPSFGATRSVSLPQRGHFAICTGSGPLN